MSDRRWDPDLQAGGIRRTVARAVAWSATSQAGKQALQFLVIPVLATLLSTADFGLMAMATVVTSFVMSLNDIGARSALQREPMLTEPLVAGVFWLNAGLGLACMLGTAALAWPVAALYGEPQLVGIMLALAPSFLFASVGFVSLSLLQRKLEQRRLSAIELAAAVAGAIAAVLAARAGAGPYSIVLQTLVSTLTLTVLALALAPVPLFTRWRRADVQPVIAYSVNLALFGAINNIARNADYLLLGRFAGAEATGLYYLAYRLVVDPVSQVAAVIGRVALPVLAGMQERSDRLRAGYLQVVGAIASVTFPATLGLLAVRHELLGVLGDKWAPSALLVVLLVPVGLIQAVFAPLGSLYQVRGRTDLMLRVGGLSAAGLTVALAIGVQWDAVGVAAAYSVVMALMAVPILIVPLGLIDLSLNALAREIARPLLAALVMAAIVTVARPFAAGLEPLAALLSLVGLGVLVHGAAILLIDRDRVRDVLAVVGARR